ncbi:outer membrane protein assembly factor BamE [Thalassococcus profundi]|uniref:Outer membrane protein assembly factor BamE n=1 Tax=Thalassococcus profundi TaxID=2282382 RepID=A0A369TNI6_9RHOB|nr:outer membrane protein assembly factor BamE [Thalassococcus profundi]RDD66833.1 outer membrane protein assembly factor BamE [Thalassococcus profundi]
MRGRRSGMKLALLVASCVALTACTERFRSHGYVPSEADLQQIVVGVDTRDTVAEVIGVPTTSGVLNASGYYYIESQVRHYGWRNPEMVDRQVLAISFSPEGVVNNIERYGLQDGQVVPISRRVTESADGDIGFIRKLFGNIGRISAENLLNPDG